MLLATNIPDFIRAMSDRIAREYQPERIILFGSWAWGKPGEDSDVDLLIVKDTPERPIDRRVTVRLLLTDLRSLTPVDLIVLTPKELSRQLQSGNAFVEEIVQTGQELYAV